MQSQPTLVLNPDELGQNPDLGMDLAVSLGIRDLELRTAWGRNLLLADDDRLNGLRCDATARGLRVAALAAPLWKWCRPEATPGRVDSFGFPTQVAPADRERWIDRALTVAQILGAPRVRVFSYLRVEPALTETLADDPLLPYALDRAREAGVRLLLENEPVCTVFRPDALLEILGKHPELGLWLDLGNLHEVGQATAATVKELAPFTEYVHIKDWRAQPEGTLEFCAAGSGDVPYLELLTALEEVRAGLPYGLETHVKGDPAAALAEGAAFLRARAAGGGSC
ncbi:sugar phosphate isomerase/epimerase family protein [Streptomyces sp. NRRL S-350]|uniref:sugar phosphate isomerase/epimerase family protein n=1 Tax=Streptomyces sp. NRRL S-350 TaxID=1463902 RepID=UPI0004BE71C0|nr:sugar phosphate isomerase/epimerase [Streptomyces sp. NRRL S-350]